MYKGIITFDLDGIVWLELGDRIDIDQIKASRSDCLFFDFEYGTLSYSHCCPPYFDVLLNYLIEIGYRIVFFSAGGKERNQIVVPQLLVNLFGSSKYNQLRSLGQFEIFSLDDLRAGYPILGEHGYVKDLSVVLTDEDSIDNVVLIEDQCIYAAHDQQPCILGLDLHKWDVTTCSDELLSSFAKNNYYYLLGIFHEYYNDKTLTALPLRIGIKQFFLENLSLEKLRMYFFKDTYLPNRDHDFVIRMVNKGLELVKKTYPDAKLYGSYSIEDHSEPKIIPYQISSCDLSRYSEEIESNSSDNSNANNDNIANDSSTDSHTPADSVDVESLSVFKLTLS